MISTTRTKRLDVARDRAKVAAKMIGRKLRDARGRRSVNAVAAECGCTANEWAAIERGEGLEILVRIAIFDGDFGFAVQEAMSGTLYDSHPEEIDDEDLGDVEAAFWRGDGIDDGRPAA